MATKNYYSVGGKLLGEQIGSGASSRVDYLTDALGSVTATVDQTATVQNTYRYKPYSAQLAKTGAASNPSYMWVGQWGYRSITAIFSNLYVRARHYSSLQGRWTTKDTLFIYMLERRIARGILRRGLKAATSLSMVLSNEAGGLYSYINNNPTVTIDYTGLNQFIGGPPIPGYTDCLTEPGHEKDPGDTWCNPATGIPFTILCDRSCVAPCTDAHEGQHRNDLRSCCSKLPACIARFGYDYCVSRYNSWNEATASWAECRAYSSGLNCIAEEKTKRDCDHCPSRCCNELSDGYNQDLPIKNRYCSGTSNPWGSPPRPCPI